MSGYNSVLSANIAVMGCPPGDPSVCATGTPCLILPAGLLSQAQNPYAPQVSGRGRGRQGRGGGRKRPAQSMAPPMPLAQAVYAAEAKPGAEQEGDRAEQEEVITVHSVIPM